MKLAARVQPTRPAPAPAEPEHSRLKRPLVNDERDENVRSHLFPLASLPTASSPSIKVAHAAWKAKHGRALSHGGDIALCLWPSDSESEFETEHEPQEHEGVC